MYTVFFRLTYTLTIPKGTLSTTVPGIEAKLSEVKTSQLEGIRMLAATLRLIHQQGNSFRTWG